MENLSFINNNINKKTRNLRSFKKVNSKIQPFIQDLVCK